MHRVTSRKRLWHGFIALAFLALFVVLIRPICDVYKLSSGIFRSGPITVTGHDAGESAHHSAVTEHGGGESTHHSDETGPCCASVDDGSLLVSAVSVPTTANDNDPFALPIVAVLLLAWPAVGVRQAAAGPPQVPLPFLPYHARSARILV